MASSAVADSFTSRDDAKRGKALQEARASGQAAPEIDSSTGKMINPHNPQFITSAPWYLNQTKPSLKHHQAWNNKNLGSTEWYKRGTVGDMKTRFAKGSCENCGATTHTKKDCTERPRQVGARWNGKNLMPDEYIDKLDLNYEAKRDRWNGYEADDYKDVIDEWEKVEGERRKRKASEMEERAKLKERLKTQKKELKKKRKVRRRQLRRQSRGMNSDGTDDTDTGTDGDSDMMDSDTDTDTDSDSDASDDEDLGEKMKDFDKTTAAVATKDDKLRTTTRNLRIREDTAKYLLNLDVNSAFYDPKSRSMRANPLAHLKEDEQGAYKGDNYVRRAGDAKALLAVQVFAWDAYKMGEKVHDVGQPTQALKMFNIYKDRSKNLSEDKQSELLDKYGGEEHLEAPKELLYGQTDDYQEYRRDGQIAKGRERLLHKSKYEEDVLIGNHTSVWGSWFNTSTSQFGYKCCQQTLRNAYCVPIKKSSEAAAVADLPPEEANVEAPVATVEAEPDASGSGSSSSSDSESASGSSGGEGDNDGAKKSKPKGRKVGLEDKRKVRALKGLTIYGETNKDARAEVTEDQPDPPKLAAKRSSAFGHVLEDLVGDLDEKQVAEAVANAKKKRKAEKPTQPGLSIDDERNRKYNTTAGDNVELSPEEYEAYKRTKQRSDDPMAKFV